MKTRSTFAAALVLAVVTPIATAGTARADELALSPPGATTSAPESYQWYGGTLLATDAASIGLVAGTFLVDDPDLQSVMAGAGAIGYFTAPVGIHVAHGNRWGAVVSIVTRAGVPVVGAFFGAGLLSCPQRDDVLIDPCPIGNAVKGGIVGMGVAALIDDLLVANVADAPAEITAARRGLSIGAAPRAEGGFTIALGGTF